MVQRRESQGIEGLNGFFGGFAHRLGAIFYVAEAPTCDYPRGVEAGSSGMRRRSLVAIFGVAGVCVLLAGLALWVAAGSQEETAATSTILAIPDNPAALAASDMQEAEVVVSLPGAVDEIPAPEA